MEENEIKKKIQEKKSFSIKVKTYLKNLINFSQFDKKTILYIFIFLILIIVSIFLLYYVLFVDKTFLYRMVVEWFVNPIYRLAILGIFLFIIIMAIQGLIVPIPSEIVLLASGMIWGVVLGGFMGVIGSMAAGLLCYYVSKKGGRPLAEKLVGEKAFNLADNFIEKYGMGAILIARFLPFISFDPISYVSGIVDFDVKKYSLATLIGSFPRAFFYSFLGYSLGIRPPIKLEDLPITKINAQSEFFNIVLLIILGVLLIMFLTYYLFARYYEKKTINESQLNKIK